MACPSCQKEWYFTDADGAERVETSHYRALTLRRKLGVPNAAIKSRKKANAAK